MKTLKRTLGKLIVLLIIFALIIVLHFTREPSKEKNPVESLELATLPMVTMHFQDMEINALHGYTFPMEAQYMRDVITPIESSRQLPISISRNDNVITNISYQVRSLDTTRLIESTSISDWKVNTDTINATLDISKIPSVDKEYLLIISLATEKHGDVHYYTRIIEQTESAIKEQVDYVKDFSNSTMNADEFEKYIGNLEIDASRDNTNLADVDITSSFNNLTWGNLTVKRVSEPCISITEISGDTSCYQLKYKIKAPNEYGDNQFYNVTEFFRLKMGVNTAYMYVYDRTVEQIFTVNTQNISTSRINLGLDSDLTIKYKSNQKGSFVSFVKNGSLWMMDMSKNQVISIFSFENLDDSNVSMEYNQYDIDIVSTDDDGNILFIVYGYMEKGAHEGRVGVSLYKYSYEDNHLKELVFVPSSKPYYLIKDTVGKFAYLTDDDLLYFTIADSIYTVAMDSNEYMQLATGLEKGNYIMNDSNTIIAWHVNGSQYEADSIRVLDVENHKDYTIQAEEGEYIRAIGFVDNDIVYGSSKKSITYTDPNGNVTNPMYKLFIRKYAPEEDEEPIETYYKKNIFITDVTIDENIITINRIEKSSNGFSPASDDKLVNRLAGNNDVIELDTIATTLKKTELVMYFAYTVTSKDELKEIYPEKIDFATENKLNLSPEKSESKFYVYAYGQLANSFTSLKKAIAYADKNFGMVVEESGEIAWAKITKPVLAKLTDTASIVKKKFKTKDDILACEDYRIFDLTGSDFSYILYYGAQNIPVITYTKDLGYVILSAYSSYLGVVDTIAFTDLKTGEITKMEYDDAVDAVKKGGNIFIVLNPLS